MAAAPEGPGDLRAPLHLPLSPPHAGGARHSSGWVLQTRASARAQRFIYFFYSSVHFAFERCQSNSKLSPTTGRGNNYSRGTDSPTMVSDSKFQGMGNVCGHQGLPVWPPHKSPLLSSLSGGITAIRCSHRAMLDACSSGKIFRFFASYVWFIQGKKKVYLFPGIIAAHFASKVNFLVN